MSDNTRAVVKELYDWRYLAELQVKGKQRTVPVFELVGRAGDASAEQREYIERFEKGRAIQAGSLGGGDRAVHADHVAAGGRRRRGERYIDACQEKLRLFRRTSRGTGRQVVAEVAGVAVEAGAPDWPAFDAPGE
ncbi:MAG: hypothetical protein U1A27_06000 [Phycisphaerae bacterium]